MELMETLLKRQSCREYAGSCPAEEQVKTLLLAACAAPVAKRQYDALELTVIRRPALLTAIRDHARAAMGNPAANPLYDAPLLILVSAKTDAQGQVPGNLLASAACLIENMTLAATDMGLGSVYLYGCIQPIRSNEALMEQLGLQPGFVPVSALAAGKAKQPQRMRTVGEDVFVIRDLD